MSSGLAVSFVLSTRNRRPAVLRTLLRVRACGLSLGDFETFVIDNASSDGTADAVAEAFPEVRLIRLGRNRGSVAKNLAIRRAGGQFVMFLDDDSWPTPGSVERMIGLFHERPRLGAASFTVTLPDGRRECSAYPNVFIGCGVGLRRAALDEVGLLPDDFFMQAEEYDLSLRLLDAGWAVESFDELHVVHEKSPAARSSAQKMRLDVRNNLLLAQRRFPGRWREAYSAEWMTRYWAIASATGRRTAAAWGYAAGMARLLSSPPGREVSEQTFEQFARVDETRRRLADAAGAYDLRRVLLIDWGKNLYAYRLACEAVGVQVVAIADPLLAGQRYRGVPVLDDAAARGLSFDAAIVANLSPVHAAARLAQWRQLTTQPVIDLFEPDRVTGAALSAA